MLNPVVLIFAMLTTALLVWVWKDPRHNLEVLKEVAMDSERRQTLVNDSKVAALKAWSEVKRGAYEVWTDPERRQDTIEALQAGAQRAGKELATSATYLKDAWQRGLNAYRLAAGEDDEGEDMSLSIGTRALNPAHENDEHASKCGPSSEEAGATVLPDNGDGRPVGRPLDDEEQAGSIPDVTMRL